MECCLPDCSASMDAAHQWTLTVVVAMFPIGARQCHWLCVIVAAIKAIMKHDIFKNRILNLGLQRYL